MLGFIEEKLFDDAVRTPTIGIVTAENPKNNKTSKPANEKRNQQLENKLQKLGCSFVKIKGKFNGKSEDSFLIFNIGRKQLVNLGNKFDQVAVIFGKKQDKRFVFHYLQDGKTTKQGSFIANQTRNDNFYFILLDKKFTIGFR